MDILSLLISIIIICLLIVLLFRSRANSGTAKELEHLERKIDMLIKQEMQLNRREIGANMKDSSD